jgi:hypothetical protein
MVLWALLIVHSSERALRMPDGRAFVNVIKNLGQGEPGQGLHRATDV